MIKVWKVFLLQRVIIPLFLMSILWTGSASGQELYVLGGMIADSRGEGNSYTWALEYMHGLGKNSAVSLSYLNEGHLPDNHRDGISAQFWGRTQMLHQRFSLMAGIGPYVFCDTQLVERGQGFHDTHGIGALASIAGIWYTGSRWLGQFRMNWVETPSSIDTYSVMLGIGYQLDAPPVRGPLSEAPSQPERTTRNEITAFLGQTISNSFDSQHATAQSVEYRRGLTRYGDVTIAWLNEGDNRLIRRNGIIAQLWIVREFFDDHIALGAGFGPYLLVDKYRDSTAEEGNEQALAGTVALSASYRFTSEWALRLSWNRVVTNYNRDTDVLMVGPAYRF